MRPTIERIENAITDFENCECDSEMILYALRVLKKLVEEPRLDMCIALTTAWEAHNGYLEASLNRFKTMRDQLLREAE